MRLPGITGWRFINNSLEKDFELDDFNKALGFTVQTGLLAEKYDHHPSILLHSWNKVKITLSTHDAGGVTEKDFHLAGNINGLL